MAIVAVRVQVPLRVQEFVPFWQKNLNIGDDHTGVVPYFGLQDLQGILQRARH